LSPLIEQLDRISSKLHRISEKFLEQREYLAQLEEEHNRLLIINRAHTHTEAEQAGTAISDNAEATPHEPSLLSNLPAYLQLIDEQISWLEQA
jgi:hypothetical protein